MNNFSVADLYNLLEYLTLSIGNGCRVSVSMSDIHLLEFKVDWLEDDLHLRYQRYVSCEELRYMGDLKIFTDWFIFMAVREYKLKTVGEE